MIKACFSILVQPANQHVNVSGTAQFVIQVSGTNISYQWQTDAGLGFQNITNAGQYSGATNDTLTVSNTTIANNNQLFRCIVTSLLCTDTSAVAILNVSPIGIDDNREQDPVTVYPNPAGNRIYVQVNARLIGSTFTIIDPMGKTVVTGKLTGETSIIEIGNLPPGAYLFSIGDNRKRTYPLIKN
ncbi:MAG: T9SS C-terminal target domain-containing protein [Bacteroidetes bacterium]|nr:MAG: T9SS C-terminal target domain-containing protein [Bacteroidota bacterium]